MRGVFVGLGSNLDDPPQQIGDALEALDASPGIAVLRVSSLYRTAPWGFRDQPDFVNAVVELDTLLSPRALLERLLDIERHAGRHRDGERYGPRIIDLDLLAYGDVVVDEPGLTLPHPRIAERAFVLVPLAEIAPAVPIHGRSAADWLQSLPPNERNGVRAL